MIQPSSEPGSFAPSSSSNNLAKTSRVEGKERSQHRIQGKESDTSGHCGQPYLVSLIGRIRDNESQTSVVYFS